MLERWLYATSNYIPTVHDDDDGVSLQKSNIGTITTTITTWRMLGVDWLKYFMIWETAATAILRLLLLLLLPSNLTASPNRYRWYKVFPIGVSRCDGWRSCHHPSTCSQHFMRGRRGRRRNWGGKEGGWDGCEGKMYRWTGQREGERIGWLEELAGWWCGRAGERASGQACGWVECIWKYSGNMIGVVVECWLWRCMVVHFLVVGCWWRIKFRI
jgi:hypothetical protein